MNENVCAFININYISLLFLSLLFHFILEKKKKEWIKVNLHKIEI